MNPLFCYQPLRATVHLETSLPQAISGTVHIFTRRLRWIDTLYMELTAPDVPLPHLQTAYPVQRFLKPHEAIEQQFRLVPDATMPVSGLYLLVRLSIRFGGKIRQLTLARIPVNG